MQPKKKLAIIGKNCVACGCCAAVCPRKAITIAWGIAACVSREACVGCGKCANVCPAALITIEDRRDSK